MSYEVKQYKNTKLKSRPHFEICYSYNKQNSLVYLLKRQIIRQEWTKRKKLVDLQEQMSLKSTAESMSVLITKTHHISPVHKGCLCVQSSTTSCS